MFMAFIHHFYVVVFLVFQNASGCDAQLFHWNLWYATFMSNLKFTPCFFFIQKESHEFWNIFVKNRVKSGPSMKIKFSERCTVNFFIPRGWHVQKLKKEKKKEPTIPGNIQRLSPSLLLLLCQLQKAIYLYLWWIHDTHFFQSWDWLKNNSFLAGHVSRRI